MRSFSSRIRSADSLAMSAAVSTEIPTSAARRAGASLMPSPMNPTTCPVPRRAWMTRCLWAGDRRAKSVACSAFAASSASESCSMSAPSSIGSGVSPTSRHTLRLISGLSPVRIFTAMPVPCRAARAPGRGRLGRVEKGNVAAAGPALVRPPWRTPACPGRSLLGYRQYPKAVVAQLVVLLLQLEHPVRDHRRPIAVEFELRASKKDFFRSALGQQNRPFLPGPGPSRTSCVA